MDFRRHLPLFPGLAAIFTAFMLLFGTGSGHRTAAVLLLTSGILFTVVSIVDSVKAKPVRPERPGRQKASHFLSRPQ